MKRERGDLVSEDQEVGILRGNLYVEGFEGGF